MECALRGGGSWLLIGWIAASIPGVASAAEEPGAILQASLDGRGLGAQPVGDMNGDGFDDIALTFAQDGAMHDLMIVFGRPGLTGTHTLSTGFPGTVL